MEPLYFAVFLLAAAHIPGSLGQASQCEKAGPQCDAACNVVLCPAEGATPITIVKCFETTQMYCQPNTTVTPAQYACTAKTCSNPDAPHDATCFGIGQFPSPYSCRKSYFCSSSGQQPAFQCECGATEFYNPATSACETPTGTECTDPARVVQCETIGQSGTIAGVTGYCFICDDKLNANVYKCTKDGGMLDDSENFDDFQGSPRAQNCSAYVPPTSSSPAPPTSVTPSSSVGPSSESPSSSVSPSSESPSSSVSPSSESPSSSTSSPTSIPPGIVCLVANQRLADPTDCHKYFICDSSLEPQSKKCLSGYRYSEVKLSCVKGDCTNSVMSRD